MSIRPGPAPEQPGPAPEQPGPAPAQPGLAGQQRYGWLARRRQKIVEEIARNRRGDYRVPTWVLTLILVAFVAAWVAVIALA